MEVFNIQNENSSNSSSCKSQVEVKKHHRGRNQRSDFLKQLEKKLEEEKIIPQGFDRKKQHIIIFFVNLFIPLILAAMAARNYLSTDEIPYMRESIFVVFGIGGFISVYSSIKLAGLEVVLKLYFILDKLVLSNIAATIAFQHFNIYSLTGKWYEYCYIFAFPVWGFYMSGNIRVIIYSLNWPKWRVMAFKIGVVVSGLTFFYIGIAYMSGFYKEQYGQNSKKGNIFKNLIILFVFGTCEMFFTFYQSISNFDQSEELKYIYSFKDQADQFDDLLLESINQESQALSEFQHQVHQHTAFQQIVFSHQAGHAFLYRYDEQGNQIIDC